MLPATKTIPCREFVDKVIPYHNYRIGDFAMACLEARNGSIVPQKEFLRPETFPSCLPHVWMYELNRDRGDFICRLAGEKAQSAVGQRMLGTGLADIVTALNYPAIAARWHRAITTEACIYGWYELARVNGQSGRAERLIMPLKGPDGCCDLVFGISLFNMTDDYRHASKEPLDEVSFYDLKEFPL